MSDNYTRIQVDAYTSYIVFDDDVDVEWFKELNDITDSVDTYVEVDEMNCIKFYTYDNEYSDCPESIDGDFPYVFANEQDGDAWLEFNNGDGHQNNLYAYTVVVDGVERTEYVDG